MLYDECLRKSVFPSDWKKGIVKVLGEGKDGSQIVSVDVPAIRQERSK